MITLVTLRNFTNKPVVNDINTFFKDKVIKAVKIGKFHIGDTEKGIFADTGAVYTENNDEWVNYDSLTLYALTIRYAQVTKKDLVFNVNNVDEDTMRKLLPFVDKFNGSILTVKIFKSLIYSDYEILVNYSRVLYGSQLFHYIINYNPKHEGLPVSETKELYMRKRADIYSFAFDSRVSTILFDTDLELELFMSNVMSSPALDQVSNTVIIPIIDETYEDCKGLAKRNGNDNKSIIRVVHCNNLTSQQITDLVDDDFQGLTVFAGVYHRYNKKQYSPYLSSMPVRRVTSYDGLYKMCFLK